MTALTDLLSTRFPHVAPSVIINSAARAGVPLAQAIALGEGETDWKHVYGNDLGGVFGRTSEADPWRGDRWVTKANAPEFMHRVVDLGEKSNGIGPTQPTYRPYLARAAREGLDMADPETAAFVGLRAYREDCLSGAGGDPAKAGTLYRWGTLSGDPAYGQAFAARVAEWEATIARLGAPTPTPTPTPAPAPTPVPTPTPTRKPRRGKRR